MSALDGSSLLTDLRRACESTKPDETPVIYTLGQLRAMLNTRDAPIASWLDAPTREGFWWVTTPARPSPALVMVNDLWRDEGTLRFAAYHFGTEDTSSEDELPGARWLYAEPPAALAAPAEVIVSNPDRAQLALFGASRPGAGLVGLAYTIDTVSPDVDATPPAAQETKS